jgi:hypothetical protein
VAIILSIAAIPRPLTITVTSLTVTVAITRVMPPPPGLEEPTFPRLRLIHVSVGWLGDRGIAGGFGLTFTATITVAVLLYVSVVF